MKYSPLYDNIIVKRIDAPTQTASGIILPTQNKEKPQEAIVKAVGTGRINNDGSITELTVREGDTVIFGKFSGTEIKIDDESFLILKEQDILVICR